MYWICSPRDTGAGVIALLTVAEGIFRCLAILSLLSAEKTVSFSLGLHQ